MLANNFANIIDSKSKTNNLKCVSACLNRFETLMFANPAVYAPEKKNFDAKLINVLFSF